MVLRLKNTSAILPRLYEDPVTYVEEISLIEEDYLWHNVQVYVDDLNSMKEFLVMQFDAKRKSLSAYMTAQDSNTIQKFAGIMRRKKGCQTHLQTLTSASYIKKHVPWLTKVYTARYHYVNSSIFKPNRKHEATAVRLTPQNIVRLDPTASPLYVKRLETAPVYGCLDEEGKLVATSGVGYVTKKSFSISYTETEPDYRGHGIAKCLTSLACEPLIKMGLIGVYAADVANQPSLGVAEGLGFKPYKDLKCFYNAH